MVDRITDRLARVRERIAQAAERAGRRATDITLITVTKTFAAAMVQQAVDAGALALGENKVQEAAEKAPKIVAAADVQWHLIGHLQSNKAKLAVQTFDVIHTLDSSALAQRLDRLAGEEQRRPVVLVQVDLGKEPTKSGADEMALSEIVQTLDACAHLQFKGLMTLPPFFDEAEKLRPYFRRLRALLEELNRQRPAAPQLTELSMGMSHDFEVAIEEGATMVRVGSAIMGERQP
ncbi:MAG: YggS family pyridoxal phosphate-dependent enzyme [Acidobacteria bacterium]|nr:YggS family pyridoxal phosphate-dependent enzyme [Acidobacteriota bacterium]